MTEPAKLLPTSNADGLPVVPMTDEQKYLFDLKGWILLPGLLTEEQLGPIREHQMKFLYEREKLAPHERDNHGGPAQILLDPPAVVAVMNEILSQQGVATEECYGFRYDHTYTSHRKFGSDNFRPHGGGGLFGFSGYQMQRGKIFSGLTRCVWELNPVEHGKGGTLLLSGSHKTAFDRPETLLPADSKLWETYECPAGSALIFTEALCHTGTKWMNEKNDRLSLFTCYNSVGQKWCGPIGGGTVPHEVIETMPAKRRTLFRGVWTGWSTGKAVNTYYDEANHAM